MKSKSEAVAVRRITMSEVLQCSKWDHEVSNVQLPLMTMMDRKEVGGKHFNPVIGFCRMTRKGEIMPIVTINEEKRDLDMDEGVNLEMETAKYLYRIEVWADDDKHARTHVQNPQYGSLKICASKNSARIPLDLSWSHGYNNLYLCRSITVVLYIKPAAAQGSIGDLSVNHPISFHNFDKCVNDDVMIVSLAEAWDDTYCCEVTKKAKKLFRMGQNMMSQSWDGWRLQMKALEVLSELNTVGLYPYDRHYIRMAGICSSLTLSHMKQPSMLPRAAHFCSMWLFLDPYNSDPGDIYADIMMKTGNDELALAGIANSRKVMGVNNSYSDVQTAMLVKWTIQEKIVQGQIQSKLADVTSESAIPPPSTSSSLAETDIETMSTTSSSSVASCLSPFTKWELDEMASMTVTAPKGSTKKNKKKNSKNKSSSRKKKRKGEKREVMGVLGATPTPSKCPEAEEEEPIIPEPLDLMNLLEGTDLPTSKPSFEVTKIDIIADSFRHCEMRAFVVDGRTMVVPCWAAMADEEDEEREREESESDAWITV